MIQRASKMNLKYLLAINGVFSIFFGMFGLFFSAQILDAYNGVVGAHSQLLVMGMSPGFIALGVTSFLVRNCELRDIKNPVLTGLFVFYLLFCMLLVKAQMSELATSARWVNLSIFSVFLIGFGYFRFFCHETTVANEDLS